MGKAVVIEAIGGVILLFLIGSALASSGVKEVASAGGWMIGVGAAIIIAIILGLVFVITRP